VSPSCCVLWTSGVALQQATVIVFGPVLDEYDNLTTDVYGASVLNGPTATRLDWATMTADSAWDRFDGTFLRPSFGVVDSVPGAP
jgi:hypothetical protein